MVGQRLLGMKVELMGGCNVLRSSWSIDFPIVRW